MTKKAGWKSDRHRRARELQLRAESKPGEAQVGAVLVFETGIDKESAEALLRPLVDRGALATFVVNDFNPNHGSPVFYVP